MRRILITIEEEISESVKVTKNSVIERTPTELLKETYKGSGEMERVFSEKLGPMEVTETRNRKNVLLKQEIEDDSTFELANVIKAINNL
jgi:23S rRNA maturation mini-RNase III